MIWRGLMVGVLVASLCASIKSATTTSSTTSTATTAPATPGRAQAVSACRRWASAGSEPEPSAIEDWNIQVDAARQASEAASLSSRWKELADAMKADAALPLTGLDSDQEAAGEMYLATIHSTCASLGVTVP